MFALRPYLRQNEATGNVEPPNAILVLVQKAYFPLWGCNLARFKHRHIGPTMKFAEIGGYISTWYRLCTKAIFPSAYFKLLGCKLQRFTNCRKGQTKKFAEIMVYLSTWYRVCTKAKITSKGSYGNVEPKNVYPCFCAQSALPITGLQTSRVHASPYTADNEICRNWGLPFHIVPCLQ